MENEILGTLLMILFDVVVVFMICGLFSKAPLALAIIGTVMFGGVGVWGTIKVIKYWIKKLNK